MAEKPKKDLQESDAGLVDTDEKRGNGEAQSPVKSVNDANHEAKENGVEKSPVPPVNEVVESADKETASMHEGEPPVQNEEKDANSNTEEQKDGAEGSKLYQYWALLVNGFFRCVDWSTKWGVSIGEGKHMLVTLQVIKSANGRENDSSTFGGFFLSADDDDDDSEEDEAGEGNGQEKVSSRFLFNLYLI